jgi:hypothetical protein
MQKHSLSHGCFMNFDALSLIFTRAWSLTLSKKKWLFVFSALVISGLLFICCRGLGLHAGQWVQLSLTFLPIFLCTGFLLPLGIVLIRIYHDEIKRREINYWQTISNSWPVIIGASYFAIPLILSYLLLWILLGVFVLLSEVPVVGESFGILLLFAPFLIHLATLVLCLLGVALLFFITPLIAFRGFESLTILKLAVKRLERDVLANLILVFMALVPVAIVIVLLSCTVMLTDSLCLECHTPVKTILSWFFMMIPFIAFLTPTVIFFFNFAAEAHVFMHKQKKS